MEVCEALQVADDDLQEDELVAAPSLALVLEHLQEGEERILSGEGATTFVVDIDFMAAQ